MEELKESFSKHVEKLQTSIISAMAEIDEGLEVTTDEWRRKDRAGNPGGGGKTCAIKGTLFENAGVNTSVVFGEIDPKFGQQILRESKNNSENSKYIMWASGISLILHPYNPRIPTVHANFRMIQVNNKFWFGGGADLTPYYPNEEDFKYFHQIWKKASGDEYPKWKNTCDKYFVNHHRDGEMRGVGGIFFDHYNSGDTAKDFEKVVEVSNHFIESYFPIVNKRSNEKYSQEDVDFQLHRRGRYVEFNLLHDRGTTFGLKTNGRTDSILISLPARCNFSYAYKPKKDSIHEKMMEYYYPKDFI